MEHVPDPSPSPEFEAIVTEECERRLDELWDDERRLVAVRRMEGYSIDEIALELGLGRRTVVRRLQSIRACWMERTPARARTRGQNGRDLAVPIGRIGRSRVSGREEFTVVRSRRSAGRDAR